MMAPQLALSTLAQIDTTKAAVPGKHLFQLPEKVLQFGTGVLLRGLIDQYIHAANVNGNYAGRVVVVKSTTSPGADAFGLQDGLFTEYVQGIEMGQRVERFVINAAISRVLHAVTEWDQVLAVAAHPQLETVVSNTTEAGLVYDATDLLVEHVPPKTFPGKLLACLYHRWKVLGPKANGCVVLPTELVVDNGMVLKKMVLDLATVNGLPASFVAWLTQENDFCNTLVDRIVPGKLPSEQVQSVTAHLGYRDDLLLVREPFGLWAIATDRKSTQEKLGFAHAPGNNVVVQADISVYRELKLRLLNGTHSFSCALALLLGFVTVKQAMENKAFVAFVDQLMLEDIAGCLKVDNIPMELVQSFSAAVKERFANPFIAHHWESISMNYAEKMRLRNVPLMRRAAQHLGRVPSNMVLGFAAFLFLYFQSSSTGKGTQESHCLDQPFILKDQFAAVLARQDNEDLMHYTNRVLSDETIWHCQLMAIEGLASSLVALLEEMNTQGVALVFAQHMVKPIH